MHELIATGALGAAWLATYLVHSTILLGATALAARLRPDLPAALLDRLWKGAAVAGLATATIASAGAAPVLGSLVVPPAAEAMHVVRETRIIEEGPGARAFVRREERVIRPGFQAAHGAGLGFAALLLVAAGRAASFARRRRRLQRVLRDRVPLAQMPDTELLARWIERIPVAAGVRISVSDTLQGPAAIGPREICLPRRTLRELAPAEQQAILAHEIAHLVRRDPMWLAALAWIRTLLFIQPLNRLALTGFQRTAELLCDDWAVAATGRPIALARSIVRVASWVRTPTPTPVAAMAEAGVSFTGRIERLVHTRSPRADRSRRLLPVSALVLVLLPFAAPRVVAAPADEPGAVRHAVRIMAVERDTVPVRVVPVDEGATRR